jgi:hypothetical protein
MMMTQISAEGNVKGYEEAARELFGYARRAATEGTPIHAVEREIWQRVLQLGRQALGAFLACQGEGDVGEKVTMPTGHEVKRLEERHLRCYQSIFGEFELPRAVYGSREGQKIEYVPLDARLQLPEGEFSYVLQDWAQALSVEYAFGRTAETLQMILGLKLPVDSLERINRKMAEVVEGFRQSLPAPAEKEEGEFLVVTADGKGIPMRRGADQTPAGCRRTKGQKANKKQMATLGCVYTVDPKQRTAAQVVAALFREKKASPDEWHDTEPVAEQKRVWSSLSYEREDKAVAGEEVVFTWMAEEVSRRRYPGQPLVCLMDGQNSLWAAREAYLPADENVVQILDLLHVTPRLWEAAYLFYPEASAEAAQFVRQRLSGILGGKTGYVVGGLRQMGTKHRLRGSKRRKLQTICNYLSSNLSRMRYDEYLREGYPIASGVIEGACRHVVKDRMERAGMRWTVEGAQAMLDLRTTYLNGHWNAFQSYRMEHERQRLYLNYNLQNHVPCRLAA